jgi:hypothetical protein
MRQWDDDSSSVEPATADIRIGPEVVEEAEFLRSLIRDRDGPALLANLLRELGGRLFVSSEGSA